MPSTNPVPYEVMSSPFAVYYGAADVAPPAVSADPDSSDWTLIGSNGDLNYDREPGLIIALPQSVNSFRAHGDLGTRKRFPTEADLMVRVRLVDMTLEQMAHALNLNSVTTPAAQTKQLGLGRSFALTTRAILVKFEMSPYMTSGRSQLYIFRAQQVASTEIRNAQGTPMGFDLEYAALVKPDEPEATRFGYFQAQTP